MNKSELAAAVANKCGMARIEAHRAINALFDVDDGIIPSTIIAGEKVLVPGFGTWLAHMRAARSGVSPLGERIHIEAKRVVTFKPGQTLRARIGAQPVAT